MDDTIIEFIFYGKKVIIQSQKMELMKNIFQKYCNKIGKDIKNFGFLYNGKVINEELKLGEINNNDQMVIIVFEKDIDDDIKLLKQSKEIICPFCKEICIISFSNYKITLRKCKNRHILSDILLTEFNETQNIDEQQILCGNCNENRKSQTYDNLFYKCCKCEINLCPLCKTSHNKEHVIIDYDSKNILCNKHGERYMFYCDECNLNLCDLCELSHNEYHNYSYLNDIIENEDENIKELRIKIDEFINEVKNNNITEYKFKKVLEFLEIYYDIVNNIFKKFNVRNKTYQSMININNIFLYNEKVINDIDNILNETTFEAKMKYIEDIYEKMNTKKKPKKFYLEKNTNSLKKINLKDNINKYNQLKIIKINNEFLLEKIN